MPQEKSALRVGRFKTPYFFFGGAAYGYEAVSAALQWTIAHVPIEQILVFGIWLKNRPVYEIEKVFTYCFSVI